MFSIISQVYSITLYSIGVYERCHAVAIGLNILYNIKNIF